MEKGVWLKKLKIKNVCPGAIQFIQTFPKKSVNTNERYCQGFRSTKNCSPTEKTQKH